MNTMIAVCGLNCAECEGYLATQANDQAAKERVAAQWAEMFNAPGLTAEFVTCDGCVTEGRKGGHCAECDVRTCGVGRGLPNCAHCADFETCDRLAKFLNFAPQARTALEEIRRML